MVNTARLLTSMYAFTRRIAAAAASEAQRIDQRATGAATLPNGYLSLGTVFPSLTMPSLIDRITVNPKQCGGRPCIRGMRIRVIDILQLLAAGETPEQILADFDYLERDDISAALEYAARRLDHPTLAA